MMALRLFQRGESVVSVFLAPSECLKLLTQSGINSIEHNARTFFDHNCRGCRLVFHRAGERGDNYGDYRSFG